MLGDDVRHRKGAGGDNENTVALASPAAALGRWVPSLFNPFLLLLYQSSRREVKRTERMEGSYGPIRRARGGLWLCLRCG